MVDKPTEILQWNPDGAHVTEPSIPDQDRGWRKEDYVFYRWMNFVWKTQSGWQALLDAVMPNDSDEQAIIELRDTITSSPYLSTAVANGRFAVIGTTAYIFGGTTTGSVVSDVIQSASITNLASWSNVGTLPIPLTGSSYLQKGTDLYLFGGKTTAANTDKIFKSSTADPTTWADTTNTLPAAVSNSHLIVADDEIQLIGGVVAGNPITAIYYAATSDPETWLTSGATLPVATNSGSIAIINNQRWLFGGDTATGVKATIYVSSSLSQSGTWVDSGYTLASVLGYSKLALIGDEVVLFGGNDGSVTDKIMAAKINDLDNWRQVGVLGQATEEAHMYIAPPATGLSLTPGKLWMFGGELAASFSNTAETNSITQKCRKLYATLGAAKSTPCFNEDAGNYTAISVHQKYSMYPWEIEGIY